MDLKNNKKKVLIIQSLIPHYRIPIFNELSQWVDLTVIYDKGSAPVGVDFNVVKVDICHIRHVPKIHKRNIVRLAKKFDVVISMLDGSFLTTHLLCYFRGKTKLILWGIGVAAGYNTRYDSSQETAYGYLKLINRSDAALFYSNYPIEKYKGLGVEETKLFVANNTVKVLAAENRERKYILFVGSLYKAKKIFELLNCYKSAFQLCTDIPKLVIIGDGDDGEAVRQWVLDNSLDEQIELPGAIYDEPELARYFSSAVMCVSPDQAGLTVLQAFGYGVPFVTHKDAITGGERLNIKNEENGILVESFDELTAVICDCAQNQEKYIKMGENAKRYYEENRTVSHMVSGFLDAIKFVLKE